MDLLEGFREGAGRGKIDHPGVEKRMLIFGERSFGKVVLLGDSRKRPRVGFESRIYIVTRSARMMLSSSEMEIFQ